MSVTTSRTLGVGTVVLILLSTTSLDALEPGQSNALEFEMSKLKGVVSYRIEIFERADDLRGAFPVLVVDVDAPKAERGGRVRVDFSQIRERLPDGDYVLTVTAVGAGGPSPRSAPSGSFTVTGSAVKPVPWTPPPPTQAPGTSSPHSAAPPHSDEGPRIDAKTAAIIALFVGLSALLVPLFK